MQFTPIGYTPYRWVFLILIFTAGPALLNAGQNTASDRNTWPDRYARIASEQALAAYRGRCNFGGTRWNQDYYVHKRWAQGHSVYKGEREIEFRRQDLQRCLGISFSPANSYSQSYVEPRPGQALRSTSTGRHDFARQYANTAVRQERENRRLRCGYGGTGWHADYYDHLRWARSSSYARAEQEIRRRGSDLELCEQRYAQPN